MRDYLFELARDVREAVSRHAHVRTSRTFAGVAVGGDTQFAIDQVAEATVRRFLQARGISVALYAEERGLELFGDDPRQVLVVDPIDGTRPAAAAIDAACISIAVAPYTPDVTIGDVSHALLMELGSGRSLYSDRERGELLATGYEHDVPCLSDETDPARMFWSIEFNGHPAQLMTRAYGHLIDASANRGGVFVFNSASFSISRIVTGQLDAYVDIGNRVLRDHPQTAAAFEAVGGGHILHLFPYDIAASVVLAEAAGVTITDAYGASLAPTRLLDSEPTNQRSCIAAATQHLHEALLQAIDWRLEGS
jgi:myo-inositol-1(or 4)-monophosphatase